MGPLEMATVDELLGELKSRGEAWALTLILPATGDEERQFVNYYGGELTSLVGMVERLRIRIRAEVLAADFTPADDEPDAAADDE